MLKLTSRLSLYAVVKFGLTALLFAIPLYPKFPLFSIPGTFVAVRVEDFLILIVAFFWTLYIYPKVKIILREKISRSVILFFIISFISILSASLVTKTVLPHLAVLHWLRRIEYMLVFFIAATVIKSEKDIAFFIKCLVIVIVLAFIYGLGQKYLYWPVITTQNMEYSKGIALIYTPGGHLASTFAGHYDLASFLVLVLPLMFVLFFTNLPLGNAKTRLISFMGVACGFWLLVNAASRISFASYLVSVSLALIFIRKVKFIPVVIIISIVFAGSSMSLVSRYTQIFEVTVKRVLGISDEKILFVVESVHAQELGFPQRRADSESPEPTPIPIFEDRSTSIRFNVEWPRALRALSKNPLLGTGFSSITLATDNDYLRLLGEIGILGFLAFILIFIRLLSQLVKVFPIPRKIELSQAYTVTIIAALPGVFLNALFIDIFEASKFAIMFWFLIGVAYAGVNLVKKTT